MVHSIPLLIPTYQTLPQCELKRPLLDPIVSANYPSLNRQWKSSIYNCLMCVFVYYLILCSLPQHQTGGMNKFWFAIRSCVESVSYCGCYVPQYEAAIYKSKGN